MKTSKVSLILLGALAIAPLVFSSCASRAGSAAAGAATYAAYDNRQDEQKKEDLQKNRSEARDNRDR
ncbi:MAG TPA: hypothetical protein VFG14_09330 [Chthoniobacteraceae bacterium]|jgi:hypothetical protein|nr:hypothetical protein [Chthoniobacteraceae bacterium]